MLYSFTIVNGNTLLPVAGWVEFRKAAGKSGRWPVPREGISFGGDEWYGFDTIVFGADGFKQYSEPLDLIEPGDYDIRLFEATPVWVWAIAGAAAVGLLAISFSD